MIVYIFELTQTGLIIASVFLANGNFKFYSNIIARFWQYFLL